MKKKVYFEKSPEPLKEKKVEWFLVVKVNGKETRTSLTLDALTDKQKFDGIVSQIKQVIEKM